MKEKLDEVGISDEEVCEIRDAVAKLTDGKAVNALYLIQGEETTGAHTAVNIQVAFTFRIIAFLCEGLMEERFSMEDARILMKLAGKVRKMHQMEKEAVEESEVATTH